MVKHVELASRKVLLPFLEPDEEAVGHAMSVTHLAPTPVGATVTARAACRGSTATRSSAR
jgi:predicted thioesterase